MCRVEKSRASGPGGQHVNKTASAIRIVHKESGLATSAERFRSQHDNIRCDTLKMTFACPTPKKDRHYYANGYLFVN